MSNYTKCLCPTDLDRAVKRRRRLTQDETQLLNDIFDTTPKPNSALRKRLADQLGMTPRAVQIWFQNRRAKMKKTLREQMEPVPIQRAKLTLRTQQTQPRNIPPSENMETSREMIGEFSEEDEASPPILQVGAGVGEPLQTFGDEFGVSELMSSLPPHVELPIPAAEDFFKSSQVNFFDPFFAFTATQNPSTIPHFPAPLWSTSSVSDMSSDDFSFDFSPHLPMRIARGYTAPEGDELLLLRAKTSAEFTSNIV
ncbi:uncharacterized protein VTP21DRAFT_822 [Calcarisporiella thermophila]|uniref:uncharacterized protein n=1 Tax=Calcarisporiella thermophila TaxID=911321 RepID=UPI0037440850